MPNNFGLEIDSDVQTTCIDALRRRRRELSENGRPTSKGDWVRAHA